MGELFERQIAATDATRASLTYKKLARYTNPTWEQKVRFGQLLEHSNKKLAIWHLRKCARRFKAAEQGGRGVSGSAADRDSGALAAQPFAGGGIGGETGGTCDSVAVILAGWPNWRKVRGQTPANGSSAPTPRIRRTRRRALAYGKSLLTRGESGAAIFIFEPLVQCGDASLELCDLYAQAL